MTVSYGDVRTRRETSEDTILSVLDRIPCSEFHNVVPSGNNKETHCLSLHRNDVTACTNKQHVVDSYGLDLHIHWKSAVGSDQGHHVFPSLARFVGIGPQHPSGIVWTRPASILLFQILVCRLL